MAAEDTSSKTTRAKSSVSRPQGVLLAGMVLLSTTAGFVGGWLGSNSKGHQALLADRQAARQIVLNESQVISEIAKTVGESVVSVNVVSETTSQDFFGFGQPVEQQSAGTGFIISSDGIVLTNRHVVPRGTNKVSVTLSDGTELEDVEVIGRTSSSDPLDVAFLKIKDAKGKDLKPVRLGDSGATQVGDKVIAIGNALGQFQNTVTSGIISGYGRSVQAFDETGTDTLQNLFQTDAAINEGNSGGPLVNINGEVIGVNTAVAGGQAENIGFAIPVNDIKGLVEGVLETGELKRPFLGVRYIQLTDDIAFELKLDTTRGAYILPAGPAGGSSILPDSPAAKADLKEKDIITKLNGTTIDEKNSLISLISQHKVGEEVTLTIIRDGKEQDVKVTLEAAPED